MRLDFILVSVKLVHTPRTQTHSAKSSVHMSSHMYNAYTHMHTVTSSPTLTGTGSVDKVGEGRGSFFSVNVPLNDGIRDKPFTELFAR